MFTAGDNGWLTLGKMKPGKGTAGDNTVAEGGEHLGTGGTMHSEQGYNVDTTVAVQCRQY